MNSFVVESTEDRYILSFDKSLLGVREIEAFLTRLRTEELALKLDINEQVDNLGEEIHEQWWGQNKERLLKRIHGSNSTGQ